MSLLVQHLYVQQACQLLPQEQLVRVLLVAMTAMVDASSGVLLALGAAVVLRINILTVEDV